MTYFPWVHCVDMPSPAQPPPALSMGFEGHEIRRGGEGGAPPPPLVRGGGSEQRNQRTKILSLSTDVAERCCAGVQEQEPNKEE